jgi:replicative DNA helicase
VSAVAGLDAQVMVRGQVPDGGKSGFRAIDQREAGLIATAQARLRTLPLTIDDAPSATVAQIRAVTRRAIRAGGCDLLVVDYLGKVQASDHARALRNRVHEVSEIARDMKATAKALGIPILLLSQLNRGVEGREDKRPGLGDLRDSGEIEQEADVVLFLHREHYYLVRHPPKRQAKEKDDAFSAREEAWHRSVLAEQGRADVVVAKQRGGRVGGTRLRFADHLTWFTDESEHDGTIEPDALGRQQRMDGT